jgi:hypothetical protein
VCNATIGFVPSPIKDPDYIHERLHRPSWYSGLVRVHTRGTNCHLSAMAEAACMTIAKRTKDPKILTVSVLDYIVKSMKTFPDSPELNIIFERTCRLLGQGIVRNLTSESMAKDDPRKADAEVPITAQMEILASIVHSLEDSRKEAVKHILVQHWSAVQHVIKDDKKKQTENSQDTLTDSELMPLLHASLLYHPCGVTNVSDEFVDLVRIHETACINDIAADVWCGYETKEADMVLPKAR